MNASNCPLSGEQIALVKRMAEGETGKLIAYDLGVAHESVWRWIKGAREAAKARTNEHLVAQAIRNGWIS